MALQMKLYLIEQNENNGYDTYNSAVVVAVSAKEAKKILPGMGGWDDRWSTWASSPDKVTTTFLGRTTSHSRWPYRKTPVICSSFNAG